MLLNVTAAAKELGLGVSTLRALIRRGALPTVRLGRRVLIRLEALERFVRDAERGKRTGIPVSGSSLR
jgi:excisionase family DNA binding protein